MLTQRLVAFCAGALSVALLSGLTRWLPGSQAPEPTLSSHSEAVLGADGAVAGAIRFDTASRSGTNPSVGDGVITPGLSADDSAPMRGISNGDGQSQQREGATQTDAPADAAASAAVSRRDGASTEAAVASAFAPATPDESASGSGASPMLADALTMLELPADRTVIEMRRVWIVDPRTDRPEDTTQVNAPADTPSTAVPSDGQNHAGFPTLGASRPDAAEHASPRAPAVTVPVDLAGDAFSSEAIDISLDDSTRVGAGHSGSGTDSFLWPGESMIGPGDLPGPAFSSPAEEWSGKGSDVGRSSPNQDARNAPPDPKPIVQGLIGFEHGGAPDFAPDFAPDGPTIAEIAATTRKPTLGLAVIPEPGTGALLASGLGGFAWLSRRRASAGSRRG